MNILITGAAQGIGASTAKKLCNSENVLMLVDLNAEKLKTFADEIRSLCKEVVEFAGDLTNPDFISSIKTYVENNEVEVLINNAGTSHPLKPFNELTVAELDLCYKINIKAPFELINLVLPEMKKRGNGTIMNVASRANVYGYVNMGIYAATKAAVTSFSGTIALENPELKAITIIPGRTNTTLQASLRGTEEAQKYQSPDYVGETIAKVVTGEIPAKSGDSVIIDFGEYKVVSELDKSDLFRGM